jgi:hypothetical protein
VAKDVICQNMLRNWNRNRDPDFYRDFGYRPVPVVPGPVTGFFFLKKITFWTYFRFNFLKYPKNSVFCICNTLLLIRT